MDDSAQGGQKHADPAADKAQSDERRREKRAGYLGFVAHEARNPLSTALWTAELLSRLSPEERAAARGEKLAAMCLRALARLRLIVEDHFLAERLEVGGIPNRPEAVSVGDTLESVVARRPAEAGPCRVSLEADLTALVDRSLFERAVDGVLAGAGRGGAEVKVDGRREGDLLVIRFQGAPPLENALAEPDKGTPSDPKGRPLALVMAVRAASAMGGRVSLAGTAYELAVTATDAPSDAAP